MGLETEPADPIWRPTSIDVGRRRALIGLSGIVVSVLGAEHAWAQGPGACVLTPEAGEGPYYLDPKLLRSDITSGQPGAPLELALQVVRAGDCATLANARVDVWHADAIGLYSGYAKQSGVGGVSTEPAVGKQYLRGPQFTDAQGNVHFRTIFPSWRTKRSWPVRSSFPTRSTRKCLRSGSRIGSTCRNGGPSTTTTRSSRGCIPRSCVSAARTPRRPFSLSRRGERFQSCAVADRDVALGHCVAGRPTSGGGAPDRASSSARLYCGSCTEKNR